MGETQTLNIARHWRFSTRNYDTLLPPGPLAERMDPAVALAGMRHCMTLRKAEGHFLSAWHHIEYAMNQNERRLDDDLRRKYLGDAVWLLAGIIDPRGRNRRTKVNPSLYVQALTLNTYLPVLTRRALNQPVSPQDCEDIYHTFGVVFRDVNSLKYEDASFKAARFSEMIGYALSARSRQPDKLMYPGSPREEASRYQPVNHDGYFIKDGVKVPTQIKLVPTERAYDDPMKTIYVEPLAKHALMRSGLVGGTDEITLGDSTAMMTELITEEIEGVIDARGKLALDYLTRSFVARYEYDSFAA